MNNLDKILLIAVVALATNHAMAVSVPMDSTLAESMARKKSTLADAVAASSEKRFDEDGFQSSQGTKRLNNLRVSSQPQDAETNPQTLEEAISASNTKRNDEDEDESRENPLSNHMRVSSQPQEEYPQTLEEAIGASSAKRFDASFSSGSPAVAILDRDRPFMEANQQRIKDEGLSIEEANYQQSITIESSKEINGEGHTGFFPTLKEYAATTFNGRRNYAISESGSIPSRKLSTAGWIAATCVFVAQIW